MPVRAPGVVQLDERLVAVIALRAESFIEKVENVTTGTEVRKGQPLAVIDPFVAAGFGMAQQMQPMHRRLRPLLSGAAYRR